jgi:hypothetical protein
MKVRADFFPITDASAATLVTIQFDNKDLQFVNKDGLQRAEVHILGRITSMTRKPIANFEDPVTVTCAPELLQAYSQQRSIYQKNVPLVPGTYRLSLIVKDMVAGNLSQQEMVLNVPRLDPDKATPSSLILADIIEKVPMNSIGAGMFVIGDSKVRPRIDDVFKRDERMGIYMKLYNLGSDDMTHKPTGEVTYEVVKNGSNETILQQTEQLADIPDASPSQVTLEKTLNLKALAPGKYTIRIKINDKNRNQTITPHAEFTVT